VKLEHENYEQWTLSQIVDGIEGCDSQSVLVPLFLSSILAVGQDKNTISHSMQTT
jgi:hypothetical protein